MHIKVPFLDLAAHHAPLRAEFDRAIGDVIDSGAFAGGPFVEKFEADFSAYNNSVFAVGVGSGTEALWLVMLACGIGEGDEVITVPTTFMATAEAITFCGARPVFVDVNDCSYTMDPAELEGRKHDLFVIEDAAQAHGAEYKGRKVGTLGDAGCFSFYPGKNLGAFGEAGAVVTDNVELQEKVRILRDHGQTRKYHHTMVGWNCRMDGIQAAVLRLKLQHLDTGNSLRRAHALQYKEALDGLDEVVKPFEASFARHVYHVYAIRVQERDEVLAFLAENGIQCGVHYPVPIHLQKAYRNLGYKTGDLPVSERTALEFLSLPMFPELTEAQIEMVSLSLRDAVATGVVA